MSHGLPEQTLWVDPPWGTLNVFRKLLDLAHASRRLCLPCVLQLCLEGDVPSPDLGDTDGGSTGASPPEDFFVGGGVSSCIWTTGGASVLEGEVKTCCDIFQKFRVFFIISPS